MNIAYIYLQVYRLFDKVTPLCADCGTICNKACCKGSDSGMYLFPGEKKVFDLVKPEWALVEESDFEYSYKGKTKNVPILICKGDCDRYLRPLACRIFPLTPYTNEGGDLEIITDPRAKAICPLAKRLDVKHYDGKFVRNIKKAFTLLMQIEEIREYMKVYSEYIDEYRKFYKE